MDYPLNFYLGNINRDSALPLYYQLKEHIKEAIVSGHFKPNDRLPTEEQLCKIFSVSRPVVRQAYEELIKEGYIDRIKGSGTFVKERSKTDSLFKSFLEFSYESKIKDFVGQSKVVKIENIKNESVAKSLAIDKDSEILHIARIIHEYEYPIMVIDIYLPRSYYYNIEGYMGMVRTTPLINVVESKYALKMTKVKRTLTASIADEEYKDYLHGKDGDILYKIESEYIDIFGRIAILENIHRLAKQTDFKVEVTRK